MELPDLPNFSKDELPEELQGKIDGSDVEITPLITELNEEVLEEQKRKFEERNQGLDRRLMKKLDQLQYLKSLYEQKESKQKNWKKIKKASRYFRSAIYEAKTLDRDA